MSKARFARPMMLNHSEISGSNRIEQAGKVKSGRYILKMRFWRGSILFGKKFFRRSLGVSAFIFSCALVSPAVDGAVILKARGKKAVVWLEGEKVRRGSYFEILNLYGEPRGLLKIIRPGRKKAIGYLIAGKMRRKWLLEPKSVKWAKRKQRTLQRRRKIAKAKAAKKRQRMRRRLASAKEEYISPSYEDDIFLDAKDSGSDSFEEDINYREEDSFERKDSSHSRKRKAAEDEPASRQRNFKLSAGLSGAAGLHSMRLKPIETTISGLGYEAGPFVEAAFQNGFSITGLLGYKSLKMINEDSLDCGSRDPCQLGLEYIKFGGDLKYTFWKNRRLDVQAGLSGAFLWIFKEPVNNAGLDENSFGLHGTLGLTAGAMIRAGKLRIPVFLTGSLFNPPPTATTSSWSLFLRAGVGYAL